jgi:hypothetical protein
MLSWRFPENELFHVFVSEFYSQVSPQMQTQLTGSWTCISMVKHAESIVDNLMQASHPSWKSWKKILFWNVLEF